MGLSTSTASVKNEAIKESIGFLNELLSLLNSSPDKAKKLVSDIVSLSEKEELRAKEARDYIAKYNVLLDDMSKLQKQAAYTLEKSEKRNRDADGSEKLNALAVAKLKEFEMRLSTMATSLNKKEGDLKKRESDLVRNQNELQIWQDRLKLLETDLQQKHLKADGHAADLRKRAQHFKSVTEGL